jgi:hypothetical protein
LLPTRRLLLDILLPSAGIKCGVLLNRATAAGGTACMPCL